MNKLFESIKSDISEYNKWITLIAGLLVAGTTIISTINSLSDSRITISTVLVLLFFAIRHICKRIISNKPLPPKVKVGFYSNKQVRIARMINILSFAFLIFPLYSFLNYLIPSKSDQCKNASPNLAILITSFTTTNDDDFSYKLYNIVESEISRVDSVSAVRINKYVKVGEKEYLDSVRRIFNDNCYKKGLLVFGKRSEASKLFDCKIFLNNLIGFNKQVLDRSGSAIVYLQNPDLINFSIDTQATAVSDFILGILCFNSKQFLCAYKKFNNAIANTSGIGHNKLRSYCRLFMGNSLLKEKRYEEAKIEYRKGIESDSSNSFIHYNLATLLLLSDDSTIARREYQVAELLNKKLINPLPRYYSGLVESKEQFSAESKSDNAKISKDKYLSLKENMNLSDKPLFSTNFNVLKKDGKFGIVDRKGQVIINFLYDSICPNTFNCYGKRHFVVVNTGRYGAVDQHGNVVVPIKHPSEDYVHFIIKAIMDADSTGQINL